MFKRICALALVLVLAVSLLPAVNAFGREPLAPESVDQCCHTIREEALKPNYFRPAIDGKLIDITPQRVADTFVYLDEHYVKNHPEQALDFYTGTAEDRANLKKLAETITAGCKTAREKADTIGRWIKGNITYDINTSAYASDTFYRREGNCLSYANLMMFLLRSLGIPAVVGDGWRGDMKAMGTELFNMEGHAWIFVRLDGQWVLYDPLWLDGGTTDRDYMAEWIYFDTVEFVTPVTDGDALPPKTSEIPLPFWTNGKYYLYSNAFPNGGGTLTYNVNNQTYVFVSNQCEPEGSQDGRLYYDGRDKSDMVMGELYRDGWVSYGEYHNDKSMAHTYAFPNGMMADGYTMEFDGKLWYMSYDSAMPILMDEGDYWIQDGLVTVKPGFSGPCLGLRWQDGCLESSIGEVFLTYENNTPDVATIDNNGNVTAHTEGYAEFRILLQRRDRNGNITLMGSALTQIFVSNEDRTPVFPNVTPFKDVVSGEFYEAPVAWALKEGITTGTDGTHFSPSQTCNRAQVVTFLWRAAGQPAPKSTKNPFKDVEKGSFYEKAVLWAVEKGITTGTDSTHFSPNAPCNRASVVTFLWRAAGQPAPKSTKNPFKDVQKGSFYEKPVLWAVEKGITTGTDGTHFSPNTSCNRAQVVTFLYRAFGE